MEKRNDVLDGLRAVAILLVFNTHFFAGYSHVEYFLHGSIFKPLIATLHAGMIGVQLFFVLSGYLMYKIYINNPAHSFRRTLSFLRDRCLRIFPANVLWTMVLVLMVIAKPPQGQLLEILNNFIVFPFIVSDTLRKYNPVTWSLVVEWHLYLVVATSLLAPYKIRKPLYFAGLAAFSLFGTHTKLNTVFQICSGDNYICFIFGSVLAELNENWKQKWSLGWILPAGVVFTCSYLWGNHNPWVQVTLGYGGFFCIVGAAFALLCQDLINRDSILKNLLCSTPLVSLGKISYSFYLVHYWVIGYILNYHPGRGASLMDMILRYPLCLLSALMVATISYACTELPYLVYKKRARAPIAGPEPALAAST